MPQAKMACPYISIAGHTYMYDYDNELPDNSNKKVQKT